MPFQRNLIKIFELYIVDILVVVVDFVVVVLVVVEVEVEVDSKIILFRFLKLSNRYFESIVLVV